MVFVDRVLGAFERSGVVGGTLTVFDLKQRLTAVGSSQAPSRKRRKGFTFSPRFGEYGFLLARFVLCAFEKSFLSLLISSSIAVYCLF